MPILLAVLTTIKGKSQIEETIFSNRFMAAPELNRMGANISIKKNKAIIIGQKKLNSADCISSDLRTTFSQLFLVLLQLTWFIIQYQEYIMV